MSFGRAVRSASRRRTELDCGYMDNGARPGGPSVDVEDLHVHRPIALDTAEARDVVFEIG
jgi:hypothetical protein